MTGWRGSSRCGLCQAHPPRSARPRPAPTALEAPFCPEGFGPGPLAPCCPSTPWHAGSPPWYTAITGSPPPLPRAGAACFGGAAPRDHVCAHLPHGHRAGQLNGRGAPELPGPERDAGGLRAVACNALMLLMAKAPRHHGVGGGLWRTGACMPQLHAAPAAV